MADVYYYVPNSEVSNATECGLKLTQWGEKEIEVEGMTKKCIIALLNPKDDIVKYRSNDYTCLRLEIKLRHCFVADAMLFEVGLESTEAMKLFNESIVQADKYIYGTYRIPECLVTTTVISDQIKVLDKRIDLPILFDNSEELYMNNIIENYREEYRNFNDMMLYTFNMKLVEAKKATMIKDDKSGIAIFQNSVGIFTVKIPSFE